MIKKINYRKLKPVSTAENGGLHMNPKIRKAWVMMSPQSLRKFAQDTYPDRYDRFNFYYRIDKLVGTKAVELSREYYTTVEKERVTIHIKEGDTACKDLSDGIGFNPGSYEVDRYRDTDIIDFRSFIVDAAFEVLENFEDYKEVLTNTPIN